MQTSDNLLTVLPDALTAEVEERATVNERLLLWLLQHPMQRQEDLALALRLHPSSVSRHLKTVVAQGWVEQVSVACGGTRHTSLSYLTSAGIRATADLVGAVPAKLARMWGAEEGGLLRLLPRVPALVQMQQVLTSLVSSAPTALASPGGPPLPLRWQWVRDYQHSFQARGQQMRCRVDAALVLAHRCSMRGNEGRERADTRYYSVLLLQDNGLVGNTDLALIRQRLTLLLRLRESAERWTHYSAFPPVLVLTPSTRSRDLWHWCARAVAAQQHLAPLRGAVVALTPGQAITSAWALSWQHLSTAGACHLQDLMRPMPRAALPPGLLAPKPAPVGTFTQEEAGNTKSLVKGDFMARASVPSAVPVMPAKPVVEREAVAWLGLRLGPREREVVLLLYAHPLVSRHELAIFLGIEAESLTRLLYELRKQSCIESQETIYGQRLLLSALGLRFVVAWLGVSLTHVAEIRRQAGDPFIQRGVKYALHTLHHTVGITRFMTRLTQAARGQGHTLLWWESGARCARRYHDQGAWHNLLPDALLCYSAGAHPIRAWLEWDEGTMRQRGLTAKLHAYAHFVQARQWQSESATLPLLLLVVPDKSQEMRVQRLARQLLGKTVLLVRTTTASRLSRHGPLASIWLPMMPSGKQAGEDEPSLQRRRGWLDLSQPSA